MSKFSTRSSSATTNLAGGKAFSMNAEMELVHAVLTTFLENKFYESGDDRLKRIVSLVKANKPEFVSQLAIVARNEFNLRSVSHVLVGELAKTHKGDSLVKDTIIACAIRPDDLIEIVAYVGSPIPKQVKRGVRNALLKFDRYSLAKYRGEGKSVSLVDLFNSCHPKAQHANKEQKKAWKDLLTGKLASFDTWETEISNTKDKKKAWEKLVKENSLGYMALLRNCNNLIKNDVSEKTIDAVVKKLTNEKEVKRSRQLPFRFMTAYENVKGNRKLTDAISTAMDIAVSNTPELSGRTLVAVDCSGSMSGDPMNKASIFGATLAKANSNVDFILYDTKVKELTMSSRTPVIDLAEKIKDEATGGGTETSLVFGYASKQAKKYDRIIIISDNESWHEGYYGSSVQSAYRTYCKSHDADPYVYAIDIQGYGTKDVTGGKVFHLCGWSDRLLDFIGKMEKGETLIQYIKDYKLQRKENEEE